jgi:ABC-2 type transport system permease protein
MNTLNSLWLSRPQQLHLLLTEAKYDLLTLWRTPGFVAPSLIFPVMFYLLFGVFLTKGGQSDYLLVTYCCFGVMGPALFNFGVNVASEKSQGWLTMKQIAPAPVSAYLFGKMVSSLLFALVIVVLLFVVAALFGQVRLYTSQWLGLAGLVLLGTIPFCLFGLWLGLTISAKAAPAVVNLIYLPMAFLGGLWLPIQLLPVSATAKLSFWTTGAWHHQSGIASALVATSAGITAVYAALCIFDHTRFSPQQECLRCPQNPC